jgi:hypothetical protein
VFRHQELLRIREPISTIAFNHHPPAADNPDTLDTIVPQELRGNAAATALGYALAN